MSDGIPQKLDVTKTVATAYRKAQDNFRSYVVLAMPVFLFALFGGSLTVSRMIDRMKRGNLAAFEFDPLTIPIQIVSAVLYVMLFANVVRRTLLGPNGPRNSLGLGWGRREFRIIGRALLVTLVLTLAYSLVFSPILLSAAGLLPILVVALAIFGPLPAMAAAVFLSCRLCTYPVAPCLDDELGFRAAFRSTRGNVLPIFGSFLLTALPFLIGMSVVSIVLSIVLGSPMVPIWENESFLVAFPFLTAIGMGFTIFGMVLLALIYEQLVLVPAGEQNQPASGTASPGVSGY